MSSYLTSPHLDNTAAASGQAFLAAFEFIAATQCLFNENWPQQAHVKDGDTFDMIIVGAGTTGSVLAGRLSEVPEWNVLVIEAGGNPDINNHVPSFWIKSANEDDWGFTTSSDSDKSKGFIGGSYHELRGKVLGGCSSVNCMIYARSTENEFNAWYEAGNEGWDWDTVLKYMKKSETLNTQTVDPTVLPYHGNSGPVSITRYNYSESINDVNFIDNVIKSFGELGQEILSDVNGANHLGVARSLGFLFEGRRVNMADAYLNPVQSRDNLFVLKDTLVTKILIDEASNRTTGVQVMLKNGSLATFNANMEVIVSAGVVGSPQLLMLSGIGPKEHLEGFDIKVVKDLPVGENLRNHPLLDFPLIVDGNFSLSENETNFEYIKYLYNRTGLLSTGGPIFADVISNIIVNGNVSYPEIEFYLNLYTDKNTLIESYAGLNYVNSVVESYANMITEGRQLLVFLCIMLHEKSTGYIRLNSTDPTIKPIIFPNYYDDISDVDTIVSAMKYITQIRDTPYFKSLNAVVGRINLTECNDYEFESDDYWGCIAIHTSRSTYHPVGTCKMGPESDPATVVDSTLLVHGMENLRVADSSIFPNTISGHPEVTCVMIGENAADIIKNKWSKIDC